MKNKETPNYKKCIPSKVISWIPKKTKIKENKKAEFSKDLFRRFFIYFLKMLV